MSDKEKPKVSDFVLPGLYWVDVNYFKPSYRQLSKFQQKKQVKKEE